MTEQERAIFYQAHKDDAELWKPAEGRDAPRQRKSLSATITVRFPPEEADRIRSMAQATGLSYSDIVREAVGIYVEPRSTLKDRNVTQDYSRSSTVDMPRPRVELSADFRQDTEVQTRSLAGSQTNHAAR